MLLNQNVRPEADLPLHGDAKGITLPIHPNKLHHQYLNIWYVYTIYMPKNQERFGKFFYHMV
jgi:hypothetical protein